MMADRRPNTLHPCSLSPLCTAAGLCRVASNGICQHARIARRSRTPPLLAAAASALFSGRRRRQSPPPPARDAEPTTRATTLSEITDTAAAQTEIARQPQIQPPSRSVLRLAMHRTPAGRETSRQFGLYGDLRRRLKRIGLQRRKP